MSSQDENNPNNLISLAEASKLSGYHKDYLSALCRTGKLAGEKIGRNWVVSKKVLEEFTNDAVTSSGDQVSIAVASKEPDGFGAVSQTVPALVAIEVTSKLAALRHKVTAARFDSKFKSLQQVVESLKLTVGRFAADKTHRVISSQLPTTGHGELKQYLIRRRRLAAVMALAIVAAVSSLLFVLHENGVGPSVGPLNIFTMHSTPRPTDNEAIGTSPIVAQPQRAAVGGGPEAQGRVAGVGTEVRGLYEVATLSELTARDLDRLILETLQNVISNNWLQTNVAGPSGTSGTTAAPVSNAPSQSSGGQSYAPIYYYPAPASNPSSGGGSIVTATDLSGERVTAATLTVTENATVQGSLTVSGDINGSIDPGFTEGSLVFAGPSGLAEDNSNLFWDNVTNSLGIGTASLNASAVLQLDSITQGLLAPRMTTVQRDAISSPATGLLIYNTTTDQFNVYAGGSWTTISGGGGGALSAITAATGNASISNSANNIVWNWQLTGAESGFTFGENVASTGGSSDQYILQAATLASSTAIPLFVNNLGAGISFQVNDVAGDTTPFIIDATGNVGIGSTSATGKLQVAGAINASMETNAFGTSSAYTALVLGATSGAAADNGGLFAFGRANKSNEPFTGLSGWDDGSARTLYFGGGGWNVPDATLLRFYTAPSYSETNNTGLIRMTLDTQGFFSIGDTSPDYLLHVEAAAGSDPSFVLANAGDVAHGITDVAQTDVILHAVPISATSGGTVITALSDTDADAFRLQGYIGSTDPTDTVPAVKVVGAKKNTTGVQDLAAAETVFQVANNDDTAALTILGNGNMGVGDATPTATLTVGSGDLFQVASTGALTFNGVATDITTGTNESLTIAPNGTGSVFVSSGVATGSGSASGFAVVSSTVSSGVVATFASTSTAAAGNTQTVLNVASSGANGTAGQVTYGAVVNNTHTGTSSTNIGLALQATGGTANYALYTTGGTVLLGGTFTQAAWGLNGIQFQVAATTYVDSSSSGTVTDVVANSFGQPTFDASSATTYTNAATVYIANAPAAGSGDTITNPYALWVDAGNVRFDGGFDLRGSMFNTSGSFTISDTANLGDGTMTVQYNGFNGYVGIGDTDPDYVLEIGDSSSTTGTSSFAMSEAGVSHGVTSLIAQSDVYFHMAAISTSAGGTAITSLSDADAQSLLIRGVFGNDVDPTDTTAAIKIIGGKGSSNNIADLGSSETVFQVANNDDTAALSVLGNANVGIGVAAPGSRLEVSGGDIVLESGNTGREIKFAGGRARICMYCEGAGSNFNIIAGSRDIRFYTDAATSGDPAGNERLVLATGGKVGVNTVSPTQGAFVVAQTDTANDEAVYIDTEESTTTQQVFAIESDTSNGSGADTLKFKITADGSTYNDPGTFTTPADVAEMYYTVGQVEAGDVVAVHPIVGTPDGTTFGVKRFDPAVDTEPVGVVSTKPGQTLGYNWKRPDILAMQKPVALAGRVPLKISLENGSVTHGDYVVPSATKPGYAMKAVTAGTVLGQALEDFTSQSVFNTIEVFLNVHYWVPRVSDLLQQGQNQGEFGSFIADLSNLNMTNARMFGNLAVRGSLYVQEDLHVRGIVRALEIQTDKLVTKQLCLEEVCVTKDQLQSLLQGLTAPPAPPPPVAPETTSSQSPTNPIPLPADAQGTGSGVSEPQALEL